MLPIVWLASVSTGCYPGRKLELDIEYGRSTVQATWILRTPIIQRIPGWTVVSVLLNRVYHDKTKPVA